MYNADDVKHFTTPEAQARARAAYLEVEAKLAGAKALLQEATAIADKAGISFRFGYEDMGLAYGMGGHYYPKNDSKGGWRSSSC